MRSTVTKRDLLASTKLFALSGIVTVGLISSLAIAGCGGGTGGGDENIGENQFVATDDSAGALKVSAPTSLATGSTGNFSASVVDANGAAVPQIQVACDSESGIALVEPNTGIEVTDSFGSISGVVGCRFPGSYQFGCRLPVGANKRKFVTIKCEGDIPAGFTGFPNAGGGGLGTGGVGVGDDGSQGGDNIEGFRVTDLSIINIVGEDTFAVDISRNNDCDGDSATLDPEPFGQDLVEVTFENSSNQEITVKSMSYRVSNVDGADSGAYTSPSIAMGARISPNGATGTTMAPFTTFGVGDKSFIGRPGTPITELFRNVTFVFTISNESGEETTVSTSFGTDFQDFDLCG